MTETTRIPDSDRQAGARRSAKSLLLPMLMTAALLVAAGYFTAKYVVIPVLSVSEGAAQQHPGGDQAPQGEIVSFEDIIVNPAGTMGRRYLKASIGLEVFDAGSKQAIEANMPRVRDALITLLSAQSIEDLSDVNRRESIRLAITEYVNQRIAPGEVHAVYFLDFVLQ